MTTFTLAESRIASGKWFGLITGPAGAAPEIEIVHLEKPFPHVAVSQTVQPDQWTVTSDIPPDLLGEGVQTCLVRMKPGGEKLGHFTIIAGSPLDEDIRAEIDLLRAELDMLKKAFRRHCLDTGA